MPPASPATLRHVVVAVLLVYVAVLNGFILNVLYVRHAARFAQLTDWTDGPRRQPTQQHPNASYAPSLLRTPHHLARSEPECSPAPAVAVLMRPRREPDALSSAPRSSSTLARLRSALSNTPNTPNADAPLVLLVATPESFQPAHRAWCASLRCRLVLIDDDALPRVFHALAELHPCLASVALLEDGVRVEAGFAARLALAPPARVTCLAGGGDALACPALAWRLPRAFLLAHGRAGGSTGASTSAAAHAPDIGPTAQLMGLAAPPAAVVGPPRAHR